MRKLNLIVIFNEDLSKTLFCIRAKEPYKGLYNFVGGKVEENETNEEAAYRELFEETGIFNKDYTGVIVDDQMYGYKTFDNGILFWKGNFLSRDTESFVSWEDLTYHYDAMILLNQLNDRIEPLPSVTDQLSFLDENNEKSVSDLEFTQEFVDRYLTEQHRDTKFSIYEQFSKSLSTENNINYLKNLYGISGSTSTIKGAGIGVNTDYKGVRLNRGYFDASAKEQLFKWNYIEKRIKTLIHEDRYLNSKELEEYPKWLDEKDQEREFIEASNNLAEKIIEEQKEEKYRKIYRLINKGDNTPIKIAKKIGSSIKSINNILIMLEIEGYIKKEKGEYTCI